jgi:PIN domain nuclease of toxin-antitoxin system
MERKASRRLGRNDREYESGAKMRYYLDTNVLVFLLFDKNPDDNLSKKVLDILADCANIFYTSSVCIRELFHLYKSGDFKTSKYKMPADVFDAIDSIGIVIESVTIKHLKYYSELETVQGHNDPSDHMIIAQSISDKIPIISSDHKFKRYLPHGLELVFNTR